MYHQIDKLDPFYLIYTEIKILASLIHGVYPYRVGNFTLVGARVPPGLRPTPEKHLH